MNKPKLYTLTLKDVYPLYLTKITKKGRTKDELDRVITWLTGYTTAELKDLVASDITFEDLVETAPAFNQNAHLITGVICGMRVENIEDPITQKIRYIDKLVDELAKGKKLEKILRN